MAIRSINLNLLPILQALLREGGVAKAAIDVGLSQPAMSGALARLRELLDDPLLVRVGRSMRLTPRAQRMRGELDQICRQIDTLFQAERFDPATAEQTFVVAAPDYIVFLLSKILLARLHDEAPRIRIKFVEVPANLPEWLDDDTIDLAVCGHFDFWPDLPFEQIFSDRIVLAVSKHHPLLKRTRVTSADLQEFPSLNYESGVVDSDSHDKTIVTGIPSLDWRSQITTSVFVNAVLLASVSSTVARAPASLVERLNNLLPLTSIELSGERTEFPTSMFWALIRQEAQDLQWLRKIIKECFTQPVVAKRRSAR